MKNNPDFCLLIKLFACLFILSSCEMMVDTQRNELTGDWWLESAQAYLEGTPVETEEVEPGEVGIRFKRNRLSFLTNDEEAGSILSRLQCRYEYDGEELLIWDILGLSYITIPVSLSGNTMVWTLSPDTDDDWLWEALDEEGVFEDCDKAEMVFRK